MKGKRMKNFSVRMEKNAELLILTPYFQTVFKNLTQSMSE